MLLLVDFAEEAISAPCSGSGGASPRAWLTVALGPKNDSGESGVCVCADTEMDDWFQHYFR